MPEPYYATVDDLRTKVGVDEAMLGDAEAIELITAAEDLVDARLGVRPVDDESGRLVVPADEDAWRIKKLAEATLEVAKILFEDPGAASRQRAKFTSGDVSTSGPYGPAYGERAMALLNQSGLRRNTARMSGGGRRRRRLDRFK
jgi:hypothetical protein